MNDSKISITLAATALAVALFAATPVGQAAGRFALAKNSVGTAQLKKSAVTGPKVKNGSLMAADFKAGQLPAGPQGPKGDPGPSDAFVVAAGSQSQGILMPKQQWTTLKSITLPAGNYVLIGRTGLYSGTPSESVRCRFEPSGTHVDTTPTLPAFSEVEMSLNDTLTLTAPTSVDLRCVTFFGIAHAYGPVITAIKVGSVR